jgi:two-component system chemotaxis response regulator CheY
MNSPRSVLVIDDEAAVRETLKAFLTKAGYAVTIAANGQAGLEALQRGPLPELILLDLMMPEMSGFEVIAVLRLHPSWKAIPIVVLTGTAGHSAEDLQVEATLRKPFDMEDVQEAMQRALAK